MAARASATSSPAASAWWAMRAGSAPAVVGERGDGALVERSTPLVRQVQLDRHPRQLVPEGVRAVLGDEHATAEAGVDRARRGVAQPLHQPRLGPAGHDGHGVEHVPRRWREPADPRQHGQPDTRRAPAVAGVASASVTKNGLPPVSRWTSSAGASVPAASSRTASSDRGCSPSQTAPLADARSPSTSRSGCSAVTSSSRYVTTRRSGRSTARRPSSAMSSIVASSAQCASSMTTRVGGPSRSAPSSVASSVSRSAAVSRPSADATSRNGPSTRGVCSASHRPTATRTPAGAERASSLTRADLPMPASPPTNAVRPWPATASISQPWSRASSLSRSRRRPIAGSHTPAVATLAADRCVSRGRSPCPWSPSTVSSTPSGMVVDAPVTLTTAGMPSSRDTMAAWLICAPTSTTTPATARKSGVQDGSVMGATRISSGWRSPGCGRIRDDPGPTGGLPRSTRPAR